LFTVVKGLPGKSGRAVLPSGESDYEDGGEEGKRRKNHRRATADDK